MPDPTVVQFLKHPATPHWYFETTRLGTDEFGVWLGAPANTPARRGLEPWTSFKSAFVMLIPTNAWYTLVVNAAPADPELYVDIAAPSQWLAPHRVEMVDLDLDIVRLRGGEVKLLDEDEFAEHSIELGYPESLIARARTTTAELFAAVEQRIEPFGEVPSKWLAELAG
jgi:protein associated with RNAse G/E